MTKEDFLERLTEGEGNGDFEKLAYKYWLMAAEAGIAVAVTGVGRRQKKFFKALDKRYQPCYTASRLSLKLS